MGYGSNAVLKRRFREEELAENARWLWWMTGRQPFPMFHTFEDDQAESWPHPRRILAQVEITGTGGLNTRYVVTNLTSPAPSPDVAAEVVWIVQTAREISQVKFCLLPSGPAGSTVCDSG